MQVSFTKSPKRIPFTNVYSSSFHNLKVKNHAFPPKIALLHRPVWISILVLTGTVPGLFQPFCPLFYFNIQNSLFNIQYSLEIPVFPAIK
jgi:hypothetical protein